MSGTNILGFRIGGTRSPSPRKDKDDDKKEKKEKKDKGDKKEKKEKKAKDTTKTHPTHPHPLSHVVPGYEAGWRCDLCKKEGKGIPIWHCEPCSYDVCDGCMNQAQATPATPAPAAAAARGFDPALPVGKGTAAIPPSAATFEDLDPTRSSQGFLETFALSASRMDALCLATPATDDAFYYAGLQLLHANNGTGGAEWPAFYARYTALFGSGSQRAKELDWRARFARFDAGLMSKEDAREFLNSIASEMRYGPERDKDGKITRSNSYFRQHSSNSSLWQPKERRGLSWPSTSSAPPTSPSYANRPVDKRHGMDVDMGDAKLVPTYVRAYWDGDGKECSACGGSSYQSPSLSLLNTEPQTTFYTTSHALTLKPQLVNELWNLYKHPSQPNFLAVLLKYLDARFIERESVVTSFMARPEKERQGRSVEDVKNEAENYKRSDVRSVLQSQQAKSCMLLAHLDELMNHKVYGSYVIGTNEFAAMYIGKLYLNVDVGTDWATIDLSHKTAFYAAVTKFCLACEKNGGALQSSYYNTRIMVLYHWLEEERQADIWNWDRFREFISIPRNDYTVQDNNWLKEINKPLSKNRNSIAQLSSSSLYTQRIQNVGEGTVKTLVAAYLTKFYETHADVHDASGWNNVLNESWVRSIIAMVRLLGAVDKPAKWLDLIKQPEISTHLPSDIVQQLQDRIDLELAPTNRKYYTDPETPVSVSIYIKNIRQLVVKVFEINTEAFYKSSREEITTDINLDGLAANIEQVYKYEDASPLQRVLRTFTFPELGNNRGVFVIEFIAAGKSSRALIRRGGFRFTERMSVAGQVLTFLDERNNTVKGVKVLIDANEYTDLPPNAPKDAAPTGEVVVPFSSSPNARRAIVIQKGDYACLDHFSHKGESYSLACGFVVDREQLIKDSNAQILVRTALYLNEQPVSLQILEDVTLTVTTQDKEHVSNTKTIKDFKLFDDRESAYIFRVPDDLRNLNLQLTAKVTVESSGSGTKTMLSGQWSCQVNQSDDRSDNYYKALLRSNVATGGYELVFTGKTGEPRPFLTTSVSLKNRYFASETSEYLSADANGVIKLGNLTNIQTVRCGEGQSWEVGPLASGLLSLPASLHGQAREGIVCVAPYMGDSQIATPPADQVVATPLAKLAPPSKSQAQLFSLAGDSSYLADLSESSLRFDPLRGLINLINLAPGDYELYYPRQQYSCRVRVAQVKYPPPEPKEGEPMVAQQYVLGTTRFLEAPQSMPVLCVRAQMFKKHELPQSSLDAWERCMASLRTADEDGVRVADNTQDKNSDWLFVQLSSLTPATRVHIFCTEFFPQYNAYEALNVTSAPDLGTVTMSNRISQYLDGRILGEEYRYVLDRKHAPRRLGNMNRQPTLLLNPWAISATDTSTQAAAAGTSFASLADSASRQGAGGARQARGLSQQADRFALDFLGDASTVLSNIRPSGKSYSLAVPRAALGAGGLVRIFVVDGLRVHSRAAMIPRLRPPKLDAPPADAKDVAKWQEQQAASKALLKDHPHKDLRLLPLAALPPQSHFVERRATESFLPGKQLVVSDITPATLGLYDSVAKMHSLFTALAPNANLQQFAFLSTWGTLSDAEKSSLYSQYACHELHFFIYRKDEPFFRRVVRPHISQKLEKQLMDYWLLSATEGTDDPRSLNNDALKVYLEPARFEALNYLERILLYHRAHRCGIWPWPGPTGGIVQHIKDLHKRAAQEGRTLTELDDPILFKNALSCGGLDPDAIKAALAAAGAMPPQQQQQPPPPPPPPEEIVMPEERASMDMDDEDAEPEMKSSISRSMAYESSAPMPPSMSPMSPMASMAPMPSMASSPPPSSAPSMSSLSRRAAPAPMPMKKMSAEREMKMEEAEEEAPRRRESKMKEKAAPKREMERAKLVSASPDLRQAQAQAGKQAQLAADLARRGNVQQAFKQLEKTQEWAESQYYQQQPKALDQHSYVKWESQRCQMNAFWVAVAEQVEADRNFLEMAPAGQQRQFRFLSPAYITAGRGSFTDQVFAMALIDLPFAPPQLSIQFAPSRVVITSAEPFIAFYRDLGTAPTAKATTGAPVAVEQNMFDPNFRTQTNYDNNTNSPYWVTKEFEVNKIYGCQVKVIGQPGCPSQKFDVMTQIPVGALPIGANGFYTRSHVLQISAGSSQQVEYLFYFPVVGKYDHYPAHVSAGNQLVAFAAPFQFNVVNRLTPPPSVPQPPVDKTTWEYISQEGTPDQVFDFLDKNGSHNYNLDYILFRCTTIEFWQRAAAALRKRHVVHNNILCWCFHYENADGIAEYLSHPILHQTRNSSFNNLIRAPFKSRLWRKDEDYQALYQHLEYAPLVNARAHTLGQVRKILNSKFGGQYTDFLQLCARKPQPDATDFMAAAYYLLLQDRIDDARRMFERIAVLPTSYQGAGGRTVPLSKGQPEVPAGLQKRDYNALLAAAPVSAPIGPAAPPNSPRYFATQIQYDYLAAYLDFLDERHRLSYTVPPIAEEMCAKYKDYPVSRWAQRFQDMGEQVKEIAALVSTVPAIAVEAPPSKDDAKSDLKAEVSKDDNKPDPERMRVLLAKMWQRTRPSFDMSVNGKQLLVDFANVPDVQLRFYVMDLELLFSTQPFFVAERSSGSDKKQNSMFIKPNITLNVTLPVPAEALLSAAAASGAAAPVQSHSVPIPDKIADSNLIIEAVVPGGIRKTLTYFANSLLLSVQPSVGQLQVLERPAAQGAPSRPIAGAYVKVYAKLASGGEPFWKDLYTDLRGRADYCSLSDAAADLGSVKSFSILIVTEKNGSVIREVAPPGL